MSVAAKTPNKIPTYPAHRRKTGLQSSQTKDFAFPEFAYD